MQIKNLGKKRVPIMIYNEKEKSVTCVLILKAVLKDDWFPRFYCIYLLHHTRYSAQYHASQSLF